MPAIPIIALIVAVAGTAMSAVGQYKQAQATKAGYDYNARVAEAEAGTARQKAGREEEIHREKVQRLLGTQKALFGAAGVDIAGGSPLLTLMSTAEEGEKEAQWIKYGGEVEATQKMNEARANRFYGKQAMKAGRFAVGSTFLTGLGQAGTSYYGMKEPTTKTTTKDYGSSSYGSSNRGSSNRGWSGSREI